MLEWGHKTFHNKGISDKILDPDPDSPDIGHIQAKEYFKKSNSKAQPQL